MVYLKRIFVETQPSLPVSISVAFRRRFKVKMNTRFCSGFGHLIVYPHEMALPCRNRLKFPISSVSVRPIGTASLSVNDDEK